MVPSQADLHEVHKIEISTIQQYQAKHHSIGLKWHGSLVTLCMLAGTELEFHQRRNGIPFLYSQDLHSMASCFQQCPAKGACWSQTLHKAIEGYQWSKLSQTRERLVLTANQKGDDPLPQARSYLHPSWSIHASLIMELGDFFDWRFFIWKLWESNKQMASCMWIHALRGCRAPRMPYFFRLKGEAPWWDLRWHVRWLTDEFTAGVVGQFGAWQTAKFFWTWQITTAKLQRLFWRLTRQSKW